jgi:hypothetical protein
MPGFLSFTEAFSEFFSNPPPTNLSNSIEEKS